MPKIPLTDAYSGENRNLDILSCVNYIPCLDSSKKKLFLVQTPGLSLFADAQRSGSIRNAWEFGGYIYAVIGDTVYKGDTAGNVTALSSKLLTSTGYVWMKSNPTQIMIVDDPYGYIVESDVVTRIVDPEFPSASGLAYQDGYFIIPRKNTGRFYLSALNDGTDWDIDFANAEGKPDDLLASFSDHRELWQFGTKSIEVWRNTGNPAFPFERIEGVFIETGLGAAASVAALDNSIYWLDENRVVQRANQYTPIVVSTREVERHFASYESVSDAIGYAMMLEGRPLYVLTFPGANRTWVLDASSGLWFRWASDAGTLGRHRGNCYVKFGQKHLVGDHLNGKIYELKTDVATDNGAPIRRVFTTPRIEGKNRETLFFSKFELDIKAGVGLATGQGSDPLMHLQWSDDDGKTWSNEHDRSMGKIGEYKKELAWYSLGRGKSRRFMCSTSDPIETVNWAAYVDVTVGNK